ncbi:multicopper oxidase family protein [Actinomadura fibrosa]|uniref:Multicopper oxidase family protein n=1 Tax=Actinomadura fibrosa TaxID=111802 RepID=A0ABW2XCI7_9ACTN|nr:multicopper oxidase domain-containing protein [Actinomadura fibrosa]
MTAADSDETRSAKLNRRALLQGGAMVGLSTLAAAVPASASPSATTNSPTAFAPGSGGPEPSPPQLKLTKFADPLRIPPVLRPRRHSAYDELTVTMRTADVTLHSELPPTPMWTYQGTYPGPTIETTSGRPLRVAWENRLSGTIPIDAFDFYLDPGDAQNPPSNYPGTAGCQEVPGVAGLPPWAAVHLHGMLTGGGNDGWMENLIGPGDVQLSAYPNHQPATTLWYHDHTHHVSRYSVYAGLAGLFVSRNAEERALDLPDGRYEVPLVLSDRNFGLDGSGALTGRSLHKVGAVSDLRLVRPHAGPYTLVNGVIWPYLNVEPRWYRFRIVNTSNARYYRLVLMADGKPVPGALKVIGTDQGLLDKPVPVEGALSLMTAERVEVLVDFSAFRGTAVKLVNTLPNIAPGGRDTRDDLLEPDVMQFRVADRRPSGRFTLPAVVSPTFKRVTHEDLPHDHPQRWILLAPPLFTAGTPGVPELWEMNEVDSAGITFPTEGIVQVRDAQGNVKTLRRKAMVYDDGKAFTPEHGSWEVWNFLAIHIVPHPMHIHLSHLQVLSREEYDVTGFDRFVRGSTTPLKFLAATPTEPYGLGDKDVVRVGTSGVVQGGHGELVSVAVRFPVVGRGVYHCHQLEHEQHMIRPLVVTPAAHMHAGGHHH